MATFFIGVGDSPGNELLSAAATANMVGNFVRPVVLDRLVSGASFLEWYAETPGGGGEFGEGPPNNPRVRGVATLSGTLPQAGTATNTALLSAATTLTGDTLIGAAITDVLEAVAQLSGGSQISVSILGDVTAAGVLFGELTITLFSELSPNARASVLGYRPCFPLLIYQDDVSHVGNLFEADGVTPAIDLYRAFRMSATYSAPPGDRLATFGARPGSIGMRVMADVDGDGTEEAAILFRRPRAGEVVALLDGGRAEKWDNVQERWLPFRTLPQRALDGVRAFEVLDPDGIYDYYARLVGLKYAQLAYDTSGIRDFIDPDKCPIEYLPLLAANFGADIDADQDPAAQRETLRQWVPLMQLKGLPRAVVVALRQLGFEGYATQVWTRPGASATEFQERPFNYSNEVPDTADALGFFPSTGVIIHLNELDGSSLSVIDDITKQTVARYLKLHVLPAHVFIRGFATDTVVGADDVANATDAVSVVTNVRTSAIAVQAGVATTAFSVSILPIRGNLAVQAGAATAAFSVEIISP